MNQLKILAPLLTLLFVFIYPIPYTLYPTYAQNPGVEVTSLFPIPDNEAKNGDILVATKDGIVRASISFDNRLFGVLQTQSLVVYQDSSGGKPVVRSGVAEVNVTTLNGSISYGDYITSSTTPGKGMRASESGYVIGVALADFNSEGVGKIPVAIKIEYAELTNPRFLGRIFSFLGTSFLENVRDPQKLGTTIRYIIAALIVILSLLFGFITFSRSLSKSIEAVGRNPLARNTIQQSMIIQVILLFFTILAGVAASFLIIRF